MKRDAKNKLIELINIRQFVDFSKPFDSSELIHTITPLANSYKDEIEDNFYSIASDSRSKSYLEDELLYIDSLISQIKDFNSDLNDLTLDRVCNFIDHSCRVGIFILMPVTEEEKERRLNLFKPKKEHPPIFKDYRSYEKYLQLLDNLDALDENGKAKKRGFQPIAKAIFDEAETLFVYHPLLKDYILFLNQTFNAGITDTSKMSDGINHKISVRKLL